MHFLKYFIKNRVFTSGGGGEAERLVPLGAGWVFNFYPRYSLGTGAEVSAWKRRRGRGCLNPPLILPVAMSTQNHGRL